MKKKENTNFMVSVKIELKKKSKVFCIKY